MNRSFQHHVQRSLRTNIFPSNRARDEDIVIINEDEGMVKGSEDGVVRISDDEDSQSVEGFLDWLDQDEEEEGETISLPATSSDSDVHTPPSSSIILPRNPPIETPLFGLNDFTHNGIRLHPGVFVELQDGDFMKIVHIVEDRRTLEVTIRGCIFRRTRRTDGVLNPKRNEVCWIICIDEDDPRDHSIQGLETRLVTDVIKRRQIRLTNQSFPALSYRDDRLNESNETIEDARVLVCRYKYLVFYPTAKARISSHPWSEKIVLRLREGECDKRPDNNAKDADIRTAWRGETILGGTQEGWLPGEKEHLRQESISNRGIKAHQSLRAPPGLDYPAGDPMTRGSVGTLLGVHDLNPVKAKSSTTPNGTIPKRDHTTLTHTSSSSPTSSMDFPSMATTRCSTVGSNSTDAISVVSNDSSNETDINSPLRQPRIHNQRKRPVPFTFDEDYDVSDQESYKGSTIIVDLTRSMRQSSIRPRKSSSGIETERTEDIIMSRFISASGTSRKRHTVVRSLKSPPRYSKRRGVEVRGASKTQWQTNGNIIDLSRPRPHTDSASPRPANPIAPLQQTSRPTTNLSSGTLPRRSLPVRPFPFRRYTFGDCFCGAGGMSRGAINAGLRVAWGFDFNLPACETFRLNFLGTPIYNVWANEFSNSKKDCKVDICHMSPPCQFFSPLHTSDGKDDDMNTASLFAIEGLLKKAKPRVVTLEETAGIVRIGSHKDYFNAVINMFTSQGFSVRCKVLSCADFGVSQQRKRLVIIASCPGEVLPPFPTPTHSKYPDRTGLKPWTTINEAIASIPPNWADHDVNHARRGAREPYSGDRTATCITTTGNGTYHPSGRPFTHREVMCLQSFPLAHKFGPVGVVKQIGNAVPPNMATVLLEEVKKALMKADGLL